MNSYGPNSHNLLDLESEYIVKSKYTLEMLIWGFHIQFDLDQLLRYFKNSEVLLQQQHDESEISIKKKIKEAKDEEIIDYLEDGLSHTYESYYDFTKSFRLSFIMIWYSFVERKLLDLCIAGGFSFENKGRNKGIFLAKKLLEKSGYTIDKEYWEELEKINKLRNIIVHQPGQLGSSEKPSGEYAPENSKTYSVEMCYPSHLDHVLENWYLPMDEVLFEYLEMKSIIEKSDRYWDINPTYEYCNHLIEFSKEMLEKIYGDLENKIS